MLDVNTNLCSSDKRNPMYDFMYSSLDEEDKPKRNKNCTCDNCFYGRDVLALEIIRLTEKLKSV